MQTKSTYAIALLLALWFAAAGFGQTINATVGGTVADASGALIPGVTVTATNTGIGIDRFRSGDNVDFLLELFGGSKRELDSLAGFQPHFAGNVEIELAMRIAPHELRHGAVESCRFRVIVRNVGAVVCEHGTDEDK